MKKIHWAVGVIVLASSWLCFAQDKSLAKTAPVRNTSYETAGERVLRHEVVVDATLEQAWSAFTTEDGLRSFAVPVVKFELKTGGNFHSNYQVGSKVGDPGTIYNTVLAYVPFKMLAFKIGLTDKFPAGPREAGTLFAVVEFERQGPKRVNIALSMMGWGNGAEWDQVYKFFDWGNGYTLETLQERFVNGPLDWQKRSLSTPGQKK